MSSGILKTLALSGLKKNGKLYVPYIITCICTVMMSYIIIFLSTCETLDKIEDGTYVKLILRFGYFVMCVFSLIFLFYTNSFLIRRRKKEFGLYNILGLGKKYVGSVLFTETMIIAAISIVGGLFFGILLSKLAELCILKIIGSVVDFSFRVNIPSLIATVVQFVVIFFIIYIRTLRQIHLNNPIELLHSENAGEKKPKANWLLAALGVALLAAAYYISVTTEEPISALTLFLFAVIMVIIATYMIFVSGSVALCKLLQKKKNYYYKTNHFVSVSSMTYRMKRNGAGLASICILCTMVLVMITSTASLFFGIDDGIAKKYLRHISVTEEVASISDIDGIYPKKVIELSDTLASGNGYKKSNILNYSKVVFMGSVGDKVYYRKNLADQGINDTAKMRQFYIIPLSDYNAMTGENVALAPDEAMIFTTKKNDYAQDFFQLDGGTRYRIVRRDANFSALRSDTMSAVPTVYVFVPDFEIAVNDLFSKIEAHDDDLFESPLIWSYCFDLDCDDESQIEFYKEYEQGIRELQDDLKGDGLALTLIDSSASHRTSVYTLYGSLFFLGIMLGLVFAFAAVLIIYYKQISEGYEDRARFDIMKKVGMTEKEIKKSINSQVLTIFFVPIITAGLHLAFAFPAITRILLMFGLENVPLIIITNVICYLAFTLFYIAVYKITSRSYFNIVNGK